MAHHTESQKNNPKVEDHPWHALTAEAVLRNMEVHEGGLSTEQVTKFYLRRSDRRQPV
jgi:hypothetical protein